MNPLHRLQCALLCVPMLAMFSLAAHASDITPIPPVANPCTPRYAAGSLIQTPPSLSSQNGSLNVQFSYQQTTDSNGNLLHCFMTPSGLQNPTLAVNPGDRLTITITNNTPPGQFGEPFNQPNCGDNQVQFTPPANGIASVGSSVNIHYHGTNVTPRCGGDNVTKTLINSNTPTQNNTFQYSFTFPADEPPGMYWYHPHVHGLAERDLLGGATGAIIVQGIQNVQPAVSGLTQRLLIVRDQPSVFGAGNEGKGNCGNGIPFQDLSVNYVPITSFVDPNNPNQIDFTPAVLQMGAGATEFWRVVSTDADTILDLQVVYDGVPQTIQIVGIDGVPTYSQDGTGQGQLIPLTEFRVPPAGRVEFLVTAPSSYVKVAQLITNNINTGRDGDCDPTRPLFNITLSRDEWSHSSGDRIPKFTALDTNRRRFGGAKFPDDGGRTRTLYFSENQPSQFFITVDGAQPTVFDNNNPPAIVTQQGAIEKWIVQNRAFENHEFHMHQIHFQVVAQENFEINGNQQAPGIDMQYLDMIEVPFWDMNKNPNGPYPDVVLKMDFRGMDIGDFVYHCHILSHEDLGMMAIIRVRDE